MTRMARRAETVTAARRYQASASLAIVMVVRVAVVVVVAMAVVIRTLTGPLGGLSTAWLPGVPAAA